MKQYLAVTKALVDSNRVRILFALRNGELCVCHLIELLQLAPSTVSKHLSILSNAGLVESRKAGRWVHYMLSEEMGIEASVMLEATFSSLAKSDQINKDNKQLKIIRRADREELCRKLQNKN
jgi:ArsR family transcriptional regulator